MHEELELDVFAQEEEEEVKPGMGGDEGDDDGDEGEDAGGSDEEENM